jgi:hypothetical protein
MGDGTYDRVKANGKHIVKWTKIIDGTPACDAGHPRGANCRAPNTGNSSHGTA